MILFDAHVHLQQGEPIDALLDSARINFSRQADKVCPGQPAAFFLLLAEIGSLDIFADLQAKAGGDRTAGGWQFRKTQEQESLLLTRDDWPAGRLFILSGRQLVTAEKLEVLALATTEKVEDGLPLARTVEMARRQEGLAVLPWGVGKWLGKRGRIVENFVQDANPERLFVGDNGGRPSFWPAPRLFENAGIRGIRLLPGSDSLPLPQEASRVGSYGGYIEGNWTEKQPAADLRRLLSDRSHPIVPFGRRVGGWQFLKTQVALRRRNRFK